MFFRSGSDQSMLPRHGSSSVTHAIARGEGATKHKGEQVWEQSIEHQHGAPANGFRDYRRNGSRSSGNSQKGIVQVPQLTSDGKRDAAVAWSGASFVSYWMQRMSIDMARGLLFMREAQQHKASISKAIRMARQAPCAPKKSMVAKRVTMGGPVGLSPGALLRSQRASPEPSPSRPHHTGATASQVWQADHALQGSPPHEGSEPSPILSQQ